MRELIEDPFLVTAPVNVRYLTGFDSTNAALLVEPGGARLFTDFRYAERAREVEGVEFEETPRYMYTDLPSLLPPRVAFEADAMTVKTLQTGQTAFFTQASPWASGQKPYRLLDLRVNADGASLTVLIERETSACLGEKPISLLRDISDSQKSDRSEVSLVDVGSMEFGLALNRLYALITEREEKRPEGSYTTYLFNSGLDKILKKIAEEAGEVIIAAKNRSSREIVSELADLFYHLLVLMVERDVKLGDVQGELARRAAQAPKTVTHELRPTKSNHTTLEQRINRDKETRMKDE